MQKYFTGPLFFSLSFSFVVFIVLGEVSCPPFLSWYFLQLLEFNSENSGQSEMRSKRDLLEMHRLRRKAANLYFSALDVNL